MSGWAAKRFWKDARVDQQGNGFAVRLDNRPVRTPAKAELVLPTRAMAEAVAAEWQAQGDRIDPLSMPVTRSANAAIDKVRTQFDEVVAHLAAYGETDLLCHRAEGPTDLNLRQARAWDPVLEWAAGHLRAPLTVTTGVVAVPQPESSLVALRAYLADLSEFELAAMHDLVGLSGSLILGCAAAADYAPPDEVWHLSRIDEDWQVEQWGVDDTAAALASHKRADFLHAAHFIGLSRFQRKQSF